jgi:hypothetical protein
VMGMCWRLQRHQRDSDAYRSNPHHKSSLTPLI